VRIIADAATQSVEVPSCGLVADTIGAGDVFAAGFIDAYVRGNLVADAVRRGSEVAAQFLCAKNFQS
jgi:sugar/nucleoside kinase (ribokinase family)